MKFQPVFLATVANGLFVAEILRKFLLGGQTILIIYELACITIAISLAFKTYRPCIEPLFLVTAAILLWGGLTIAASSYSPNVYFFGARTYLFPIAALLTGIRLCQLIGHIKFVRLTFSCVTFWIVVITGVALAQLFVGFDHFLTIGVGNHEAVGLGTWGDDSELFRTTSIFQHTGKYGQIVFLLAAYSLYYRSSYLSRPAWRGILLLLEVAAIVISGQRAGFIGYIFLLVVVALRSGRSAIRSFAGLALFVLVIIFIVSQSTYGVFERGLSGFEEIPERIESNFVIPIGFVLDHYFFWGVGFGALSFGAIQYGGDSLLSFIRVGSAEGSFVRIAVETGIVGVILALLFVFAAIVAAFNYGRAAQAYDRSIRRGASIYSSFLITTLIVLLFWSLTHDVLAATATMGIVFFFAAPVFSCAFGSSLREQTL